MATTTPSVTWYTPESRTAAYDASRIPSQTLGQDDFLKLLVTQMTQQDPMNPQSDTAFIGQMAQFSALEQSKSMQKDMAAMRTEQQLTQAQGLLGQTVTVQPEKGEPITGSVSGIKVEDGVPKIIVGGQAYTISQVVSAKPLNEQFGQAQALLGQTVTIQPEKGDVVSGKVTGIRVENGTPMIVVGNQAYDISRVVSAKPSADQKDNGLLSQASTLMGKQIQVVGDDGVVVAGQVTGVQVVDGDPRVLVNGTAYPLGSIRSVSAGTSSLESELTRWQAEQRILQANALVGRVVGLQVDQENTLTGLVSGVKIEAGTPKIIVDGRSYDLSQVLTISPGLSETTS